MDRIMPIFKAVVLMAFIIFIPFVSKSQDCPMVKISDFPKKDLPSIADHQQLKGKESYKYYYGINVPIDYVKARHIAFIEMEKDSPNVSDPFGGASILMMLYANGFGVKQDINLCIRLACANVGFAPAEVDGRIQHLKDMQAGKSKGVFDICDDITSGYMEGFCSSLQSEKEAITLKASLNTIIKKWPQKDQLAYVKLRKAASDFFDTRATSEVDMSGTARVEMQNEESDSLEESFLTSIRLADKCSFPNYTANNFTNSDKKLNAVYLKIMNGVLDEDTTMTGVISKYGIKLTQRQWILYRNAWVTFEAIHCPGTSTETIETYFTKQRIAQLQDLADTFFR
jgi:uncharacterized protein YecT (DUF1311 family)